MKPKLLFVELNEFNRDLLEDAADALHLKNLQRVCSLKMAETYTDDTYDSDFLEPWVQWVSVHTGVPSTVHQIKHLGDVPHLENPQIWERLSELGVTSGIWGVMNANRGHAENCKFFVPDPWTMSENAYPQELNHFLAPLRYISTNYLNLSKRNMLHLTKNFLRTFQKAGISRALYKECAALLKNCFKHGMKPYVFITVAEYLSALLFLEYKKKHDTTFNLLFINSLAHIQHHHWKGFNYRSNNAIIYGLNYLDRIFGHIFEALAEGEELIVTNALSQKNTNNETPWILYRQEDQADFLKTVGIKYSKVEPLMTHDAHIFFNTKEDAEVAKKILKEAKIYEKPMFLVESYQEDPNKLFYRICFTDQVEKDAVLNINGKSHLFFKLFKPIIRRTGKHIPEGTIYTTLDSIQERIYNHDIAQSVISLYQNDELQKSA